VKLRERRAAELAEEPPPELRRFGRDDCAGLLGRDPEPRGCTVYQDRAAWVEARRAWEAAHGVTLAAWFAAMLDDGERRGSLRGLNEVFSVYFTEGDDDEDPR
jgi:hypothetical protein